MSAGHLEFFSNGSKSAPTGWEQGKIFQHIEEAVMPTYYPKPKAVS